MVQGVWGRMAINKLICDDVGGKRLDPLAQGNTFDPNLALLTGLTHPPLAALASVSPSSWLNRRDDDFRHLDSQPPALAVKGQLSAP
jgi:hypothetical protein